MAATSASTQVAPQAVERADADVGDKEIVRADGEQPFRGIIRRRACHVMSGIAKQLDNAGQRVLVVVEDEDSER